jgi:hypothetical protein
MNRSVPTTKLRVGDELFALGVVESVDDMGFTFRNITGDLQVRYHAHFDTLIVVGHSSFVRDLVEVMHDN